MTTSASASPMIAVRPPGPLARAIIDLDHQYLSTSLSRTAQLVGVHAHGAYVTDVDGNRFLDFGSGIGVTILGHTHQRVVAAIREQAEKLIHVNSCDYFSVPQVEYARRLTKYAPGTGPKRVFFSNSGSEAVETAIKSAIYHTNRTGFIAFTGGFHGRTMGALGLTSNAAVSRRRYISSVMGNVAFAPFANPYRNPFSGDCATAAIDYLERHVLDRVMPTEDCAAIVFEPVQGAGGYIVPPAEFLRGLERVCRDRGILLIADEVQTGFAKTGHMFASEAFGIQPDLICLSKAIAAGLPMGATVGRAELLEWEGNTHENTLGGNPVVLAAALSVLDVIEEESLCDRARELGARVIGGVRSLQSNYDLIGDVRGIGAMIGFELVQDLATKDPHPAARDRFIEECFQRGLLVLGAGASSIRLSPPLILTNDQVEIGLAIMREALNATI